MRSFRVMLGAPAKRRRGTPTHGSSSLHNNGDVIYVPSVGQESGGLGEVTVVVGKKQVPPSLVDVAPSAERLSKLSVTGDHAKAVSSTISPRSCCRDSCRRCRC